MATLVSAVITSVRYYIKDTGATNPNWADAEILEYINQAQEIIFQRLADRKSDIGMSATTIALNASNAAYSVPASFWKHKVLFVTGEERTLSQVDHDYVLTYNELISDDKDVPTCFSIFNDQFHLRPQPDGAYTLNVYYYAQPSALTTSSNMPFKELYNQAIKQYAVAKCFLRDEFNIDRENSALEMLIRIADNLSMKGRNQVLRRANAYRWEYERLV